MEVPSEVLLAGQEVVPPVVMRLVQLRLPLSHFAPAQGIQGPRSVFQMASHLEETLQHTNSYTETDNSEHLALQLTYKTWSIIVSNLTEAVSKHFKSGVFLFE